MPLPGKLAAIDDCPAHRGAVSTHEFRQRVHDDIRAVFEWTQQYRRRDGVIDDQRNLMAMRDFGQCFEVADVPGGIAYALAEHRAGVPVDQLFDRSRMIALAKSNIDTELRQKMRKQGMRGAVKLWDGDEVFADLSDIQHCIVERRLPGADGECSDPAFEGGNAPFEHIVGRIADAPIAMALDFEIKERRRLLRAVESIGYGLINWDSYGLCGRIRIVAAMNCNRFAPHPDVSSDLTIEDYEHRYTLFSVSCCYTSVKRGKWL
jgi:hypothetical protein